MRSRLALRIAYDGAAFDSYARMPGRRTVEDALVAALGHEGYVDGSFRTGSRTDAGVSAFENVCSATVERTTLRGIVPAVQAHLPDGLWLTAAAPVPDAWNPRHAKRRTYLHHAYARGEDAQRLAAACAAFVGRHDMRAFARMEAGRNPQRNLFAVDVRAEPPLWVFRVEGDGFLWNQVRRMVGAALAVGRAEAEVADIEASLRTGRAHPRFRLAAAEGLVLARIEHDGLAWDPELGMLGQQLVARPLQDAAGRLAVARHLAALAPWRDPSQR